jgi:hypothetical protein
MRRTADFLMVGVMAFVLAGCAGPSKPKPAELAPAASLLAVKKVWSASIGEVGFPLEVKLVGSDIFVASSSGSISSLDSDTGVVRWTSDIGKKISAGVGADGEKTAVVTTDGFSPSAPTPAEIFLPISDVHRTPPVSESKLEIDPELDATYMSEPTSFTSRGKPTSPIDADQTFFTAKSEAAGASSAGFGLDGPAHPANTKAITPTIRKSAVRRMCRFRLTSIR